ncbi:hypothetical protein PV328_011440 [Microctonus aethiopoides]|uniref:Peptidase S1 domain-containing protein n=1 Tax=Microctonus aethiopoides TaxID=144406 RepID=A0AA39EVU7_9HYME|nr:hypothetical protein PV328_011440 [Microctonus aethiopoides]
MTGGTNTTIDHAPYLVSLELNNYHHCVGGIINKNWVITAGHCIKESKKLYKIRAGSSITLSGGSLHTIKNIVVHPNYFKDIKGRCHNDIALISVNKEFKFDKSCLPLKFCSYHNLFANIFGMVSAYKGVTENSMPRNLKYLYLKTVTKAQCDNYYKALSGISENQFCAFSALPDSDTCYGDSGSPFIINNCLMGTVSWGIGCAGPKIPGVYTEVKPYRSWIDQVMTTYY